MKLDRLVSILVLLLRRERMQAKELAEMFEVSVRTILRDVDAINLAGIPIVTFQGANGGIGIAEGYKLDRSVLDGDDIAAIITMLKGVSGSVPDRKYEILLEKFRNSLPSTQAEAVNTKVNQLVIDLSPWGGPGTSKDLMAAIRRAIEDRKELDIEYVDSYGNRTGRRVEPYSLVLKGQKWYLYAWCGSRQEFRFFKLSRIKELRCTDMEFKARQVSVDQHPWDEEWKSTGNTVTLQLLFEKELEGIITEWFGESIERQEDGKLMVCTSLPENQWLYGYILSFGMGVEVINPPHIRKILAGISKGLYEKYSAGT